MKAIMPFVLIIAALVSCRGGNKETGSSLQKFIYTDYKIWGEEERETVTTRIQFRRGGRNGTTMVLNSSGEVKLDGETLTADSVGKIGVFYEVHKPLIHFTGKHIISFVDESGEEHKQVFRYEPFEISSLPELVSREDLVLELTALKDKAVLHIILADTSFNSNDINSIDTVEDGKLLITRERLNALVNGPVTLQLIHNNNNVIREDGRRTGHLSVSYSLQREFVLKD